MATNYTVLTNKKTGEAFNAATLNARYDELDGAIEDLKDGSAALGSPEILSMVNSAHDHEDAGGGGQITADAIDSESATDGYVMTADGLGGASWQPKVMPTTYRKGLRLQRLGADSLLIGTGSAIVAGTVINKATQTVRNPSDSTHWMGNDNDEESDAWLWIYMNNAGEIGFYRYPPYLTLPSEEAILAKCVVDESGWDGTVGNGLNESFITYDDGAGTYADVDADSLPGDNIPEGAYLVIFHGGPWEGRGKGSGAGYSGNYLSVAHIQEVDTTNQIIQVMAMHDIAINDDDLLYIVENGDFLYRKGPMDWEWWLLLGAIWNDSGGDLAAGRLAHEGVYDADEGSNASTTSSSWSAVDSNFAFDVFLSGRRDVEVGFNGCCKLDTNDSIGNLNLNMDGVAYLHDDGMLRHKRSTLASVRNLSFQRRLIYPNTTYCSLLPGTHNLELTFKEENTAGNFIIYLGAGTANADFHPQMWVRERRSRRR